jgi:group I intron endonuclease
MKGTNVIYKITNLLDSKCYIGQAKNLEKRIKTHKRNVDKVKSPLYSAIKSHGWNQFSVKIIHIAETYEQLDQLEIDYIKKHQSLYPVGYNLTEGGTGGDLATNHPNREHLYDSRKGRVPWNKGKKGLQTSWNKDTKGVMKSNRTTFKPGKEHSMYGKKQSSETVAKRRANTDYSKVKRRTVTVLQCHEDGLIIKQWTSIKEVSDRYSLSKGLLRYYLDKPKTLKGYIWKRKK